MATSLSKEDYLKRYLSGGKDDTKKKKKKKKAQGAVKAPRYYKAFSSFFLREKA